MTDISHFRVSKLVLVNVKFSAQYSDTCLLMLIGVEEAGNTLVHKHFFDTLTINPRFGSDTILRQARSKEINLRYFPDGMVGVEVIVCNISSQIDFFMHCVF